MKLMTVENGGKIMSNISLAVKYRPKEFEDVVSQDVITDILRQQIKDGTFSHVYLFCGVAGCGKTTVARILANEISGNRFSTIEIDAASNNGVENVRSIIDDARKMPVGSKYKVYILDEVHMLSTGAWNALLKLLEEPPATAVFIMCTTDPQKIPNTILSRVQRFDFSKIPYESIVQRLLYISEQENLGVDKNVLEYIAKLANGGLRAAVSMLDKISGLQDVNNLEEVSKALGSIDFDTLFDLMDAFICADYLSAISTFQKLNDLGVDTKTAMYQFNHFVLDVCKIKMFGEFKYSEIPETKEYCDLIHEMDRDDCINVLNWTQGVLKNLRWERTPLIFVQCEILGTFAVGY